MISDLYHHAYLLEILDRLSGDQGAEIRESARAVISKWEALPRLDPFLPRRWRELLELPVDKLREAVLAKTDEGDRLRHSAPFPGILTNKEKFDIRQQVKESLGACTTAIVH